MVHPAITRNLDRPPVAAGLERQNPLRQGGKNGWVEIGRYDARSWVTRRSQGLRRAGALAGDPQRHSFLGLPLAQLGRAAEAEREGKRGIELAGADATYVPYCQHVLARIYLLTGQPEKALDLLESLLKVPYVW